MLMMKTVKFDIVPNRNFRRAKRPMLYQSAKKYRPRDFDGKIKEWPKNTVSGSLVFAQNRSRRVDIAELICQSQINGHE